MRDEEIDNMDELIREASNSHHPAYDDKAWEKMEALLNEHLPVKKDRRRNIVFLLLLLFIIGAGLFTVYQIRDKKKVIGEKSSSAKIPLQFSDANNPRPGMQLTIKDPGGNSVTTRLGLEKNSYQTNKKNANSLLPNKSFAVREGHLTNHDQAGSADFIAHEGNDNITSSNTDEPLSSENEMPSASATTSFGDQSLVLDIQPVKADQFRTNPYKGITTTSLFISTGKTGAKQVNRNSFSNNFAVTLSAGPDLSYVSLDKGGTTRLNYGIGVKYAVSKKFTLGTGFFIANKTYSANGYYYHPPAWYWTNRVYLNSVDGDCSLYEIPLSATYNFRQSNRHSWFVGLGLSTVFMKKETYSYLYEDSLGQSKYKTWTLLNGERHYFAMLTFSGGYQYQVNDRISLITEPYFKLPLYGIGFGKINLNSGGLLFTVSIKPFAKRN